MNPSKLKAVQERAKQNKIRSFNKHIARQKEKPVYKSRQYLNEIRISNRSGSYVNHFRYFPNNREEHEDRKYEVFKYLRKLKHELIVEAIFLNGSRADILDLTTGVIYEVIFTETEEECQEKVKSYPDRFETRIIDAKLPFNKGDILA